MLHWCCHGVQAKTCKACNPNPLLWLIDATFDILYRIRKRWRAWRK